MAVEKLALVETDKSDFMRRGSVGTVSWPGAFGGFWQENSRHSDRRAGGFTLKRESPIPASNQPSRKSLAAAVKAGNRGSVRIQINSDKNVAVDTRVIQFVRGEVNRLLKRFGSKLTRVEVHLSDVNSRKFGVNDKRCLIEARPARHRPLTANNRAQTVRLAVSGALTKLRSGLETFYGRLENRGEDTVTPKRKRPPIGRRRAPVGSDSSRVHRVARSRTKSKRPSVTAGRRVSPALA